MANHKLYILCYPRTASRYFNAILSSALSEKEIHKTHNRDIVTNGGRLIGLIREPKSQLTSALAQGIEFDDIHMENATGIEDLITKQIKFQTNVYLKTMDAIIKRSELILDYDFITKSPKDAAKVVLDLINEQDLGLPLNIPETQIDDKMQYMKSSKESTSYQMVKAIVDSYDLSALTEKYLEALSYAYKP